MRKLIAISICIIGFLPFIACKRSGVPGGTNTIRISGFTTQKIQFTSPATTDNPPAGYIKYYNDNLKLTTYYPSSWTMEEGVLGSVAAFYSPQESKTDVIYDNVNIIVEDIAELPASFSKYSELYLNQINEIISNANILYVGETTLSGNRAGKFIFTGTQDAMNLKFLQIWALIENKAYLLTYTADISSFEKFLLEAEQIIAGFKVK